jgi:hypothetical protein
MLSAINGIPINWDNAQDDDLFRGLLPMQLQQNGLDAFPKVQETLPPFMRLSPEEVVAQRGLVLAFDKDGFKTYYDKSSASYVLEGIEVTGNKKYHPTKTITIGKFELVLFILSDALQLREINKLVEPQPNQILLLLETNDKHNRFGSVMYSKIGVDAIKSKDLPFAETFQHISGYEIQITTKQLNQLLTKDSLGDKAIMVAKLINISATIPSLAVSKLTKFLANFTADLLAANIRKLMIAEKYWNPDLKEGYTEKFFRNGTEQLAIKEAGRKGPSKMSVEHVLRAATAEIDNGLNAFDKYFGQIVNNLPMRIRSVVQKGGESILAQIVEVKDFLLEKAVVFADMLLKGGYQYVNGLLCGIVNGIIEGLAGTLELFAMIFRATSELHKMTNDIFDTFTFLKEMLENVIEAFLEHQLGKFLKILANVPFRIIDALAQFNVKEVLQSAGTLISGMTPAKIGYFIGYAGGMVIEMALEALFTAGIATAAKVALKYSKKLAEGVTTAANQGANAIRKVSQANADTFIKQITALFESLRKKEAIPLLQKWIDDLILEIKKALGLVDEVVEKYSDLERKVSSLLDDLGGKILNETELKTLKKLLKDKYEVELKILNEYSSYDKLPITKGGKTKWINAKDLYKDWHKRKVAGKFHEGPPPMIILRNDIKNGIKASELTVFHEMVHMNVWKSGKKMNLIDEEILVFEEIFKVKDKFKWTDAELIDAYDYVNWVVSEANKAGSKIPKVSNEYIEQLKWKHQFKF